MPRIFDNIATDLLPALRQSLEIGERSDFCVGYFNLRGWKAIDSLVEKWEGGPGKQCRLLVGMQRLPQDELRDAYSLLPKEDEMSNQVVIRMKRRLINLIATLPFHCIGAVSASHQSATVTDQRYNLGHDSGSLE